MHRMVRAPLIRIVHLYIVVPVEFSTASIVTAVWCEYELRLKTRSREFLLLSSLQIWFSTLHRLASRTPFARRITVCFGIRFGTQTNDDVVISTNAN